LNIILCEILQIQEIDPDVFYEFFKGFSSSQIRLNRELIKRTKDSNNLRELYGKCDIVTVNKLNTLAITLATFFQQQELFEQLREKIAK
ncbi:MAG: hypothetical protein ACFFBD_17640, partial [Candidatus Hodarchaeota archaeon]